MKTQHHPHQILLQPTDVLFFRDGRPMTGAHAGHTAAWPLPDITNHALHAALHRAGLNGVHSHNHTEGNNRRRRSASRKFGSLLTAGPFPVRVEESGQLTWFFPRPQDAPLAGSVEVTLVPATNAGAPPDDRWTGSSLPAMLRYAVVNTRPPSKDTKGEPWINAAALAQYLGNGAGNEKPAFVRDEEIADQEAQIGIAIDPDTQTAGRGAVSGMIYSAHYLRLRDHWRLGLFAEAMDKLDSDPTQRRDLIAELFRDGPHRILVGGQQRICTACATTTDGDPLPLPTGLTQPNQFHRLPDGKFAVKWILLSPAIWPEIPAGTAANGTTRQHHPGGWLPNWVCPQSGAVLLRIVPREERRRRRSLDYTNRGYDGSANSQEIRARLVAALVPKPLVVTGWALSTEANPDDHGAKSTHLAVPAGAVYYFEADSPDEAANLASVLNWQADSAANQIKNRRSTLLGEKGYGLGICGTWQHQVTPTSGNVPGAATNPETK